jgi:hypothetical protein
MKALNQASIGRVLGGSVLLPALLMSLVACTGSDSGSGKTDDKSNESDASAEAPGEKDDQADDESDEKSDAAAAEDDEESDPPKTEETTEDPPEETDDPTETDDETTVERTDEPSTDEPSTDEPPDTETDGGGASDDPDAAPPGTVTPIDPPADCTVTNKTISTTYCEVYETCGANSMYSYCTDGGSGTWNCSCSGGALSGSYALTGVEGDTACEVTRDLCLQGVAPDFGADTDCTTSYQSSSATYCDLEQTCAQSAEVREGVTALSSAYYTSDCSDLGDGSMSCQCSGPLGTRYFTVSGTDGTTACEASVALCSPSTDVETTRDCITSTQSVNSGSCSMELSCENTLQLEGGATATVTDAPYASCSLTNEKLACEADTACEESLDICNVTDAIQPEGDIVCDTPAQTASTSSCSSTLQCTQPALVNGTKIGVYGTVYTSCSNLSEGEWTCSCQSGNASTAFNYQAPEGADPWDACTGASEACREQVNVQIGNGSGFLIE